jgi:hypothetical protein
MDPQPDPPDETRYRLCVRTTNFPWKRTEVELGLSDAGIDYALDGRSGLRPYSGLTGIRLQLLSPRPWIGLVELRFAKGLPLFVDSQAPDRAVGPERDRAYTDFVTELHRRLAPDDRRRIAFRRGISPMRHKIVIAGTAVMAAPLLVVLLLVLAGRAPIGDALWPLVGGGVLVAGFAGLARTTRPGSYDPERLPADLVPGS